MKFKFWTMALIAAVGFSVASSDQGLAQTVHGRTVDYVVKQEKQKKSNVNVDVKKSAKDGTKEIRIVVEGNVDPAQINKLVAQALAGTAKSGRKVQKVTVAPHGKKHQRIVRFEPQTGGGKTEKRFVIGVETEELTGQAKKVLGLEKKGGVLITRVVSDSPAQKAGLKKFDVIRRIGKHDVKTRLDLVRAVELSGEKGGNVVVLRGTKPLNVQVKPTTRLILDGTDLNLNQEVDFQIEKIVGNEIKGLKNKIDKKANVVVEFLSDMAIHNKEGHKIIKLQDVEVMIDGLKKDLNNEVIELADVVVMESKKQGQTIVKPKTHSFTWKSGAKKGSGKAVAGWVPQGKISTGTVSGGNFKWVPKDSTQSALNKINNNLSKMQKDMNRLANRIERLIKVLEK